MAMRLTPVPVRSVMDLRASLLSAGWMSTRAFCTKSARVAGLMRPLAAAWSMVFSSAEANTSTGAPFSICLSSGPEAAKLLVTVTPGLAFSRRP